MRSYTTWIGGTERDPVRWIYGVTAQSLIDGDLGALSAKAAGDTLPIDGLPDGAQHLTGRMGVCSFDDVEDASRAARRASTEWARWSAADRCKLFDIVASLLAERRDEYAAVLVAEGHPAGLVQIEIDGLMASLTPEAKDETLRLLEDHREIGDRRVAYLRRPDGVIGLNPPANAAATNSLYGLGAIIAGNTIVVRAPTTVPLGTGWLWHEIVRPALQTLGAPAGVANLICYSAAEVLDHWRETPNIDTLVYFGSSARGLRFGEQWHQSGKKAVLELAGNDGVLVWHDADLDAAVNALMECFYGSAQICLVPKYAIVHPAVAEQVLDRLVARASAIVPHDLADPDAVLAPVLDQNGFFDVLENAIDNGCEILCGGRRLDGAGTYTSSGAFIEPTVLRVNGFDRAVKTSAVTQETFFPLLPVVVADLHTTEDALLAECLDFMNANEYGLRNSVHCAAGQVVDEVLRSLHNGGIVKINDSHVATTTGAPTWGGTGLTGGPYGQTNIPALATTRLQTVIRQRSTDTP